MKPILYIIFAGSLLFFSSCREEIISPGNIAGNINEPVKLNSPSSYSFIINAQNISSNVLDTSPFIALKSSCYVTILGYTSGSVQIIIAGRSNAVIYQESFASDVSSFPAVFEGVSPEYIQIRFTNFSGKLRFDLNKLQ